MLSRVEDVRVMVGFVPRSGRRKDAVWRWLVRHWNVVSALACITIAALLLATATLPSILAPFVLGPLGAIIVTALITPSSDAGRASRRTTDARVRRPV